MTYVFASFIIQ